VQNLRIGVPLWGAIALLFVAVGGCAKKIPAAVELPASFLTLTVSLERTPLERELDGTTEATNQGTVSAQTSGRVAEILYDVNDFVPAGAVIMRLQGTQQRAGLQQARAALAEARARNEEALTNYQRIADMYQRRVVAKASVDQATATRDAAAARLSAAEAGIASAKEGVAYTEIRAPYAGVVTKRLVEVGESVSPGTALMSGLSLQYLRVNVNIPQSVMDAVRRWRQGAVYVGGQRIEATKITIFPEAAAPSNTFRARLELPANALDLYPGMYVKVGLVVGEAERLLVPATALVERSEVTAVYVFEPKQGTALRYVRLGHRFGDRVEVLSGLSVGEQIALDPIAAAQANGNVHSS
jgi:RND family efflux transporter MFP subunit